MNKSGDTYCFIFKTWHCESIEYWTLIWQAVGIIVTIIVGTIGAYKIYQELHESNRQKLLHNENKKISDQLQRTEFFLTQHRRLFDNVDLYSVLCYIDDDNIFLSMPFMADKKRKFLTFFEEIALLVKSGQIDSNVAYYMFGYYAEKAIAGKNFSKDIDVCVEYWGLLFEFVEGYRVYKINNQSGPPVGMQL